MVNLKIKWILALARLGNLASGGSTLCVYLFLGFIIYYTENLFFPKMQVDTMTLFYRTCMTYIKRFWLIKTATCYKMLRVLAVSNQFKGRDSEIAPTRYSV